jgi:hypothetical protein
MMVGTALIIIIFKQLRIRYATLSCFSFIRRDFGHRGNNGGRKYFVDDDDDDDDDDYRQIVRKEYDDHALGHAKDTRIQA